MILNIIMLIILLRFLLESVLLCLNYLNLSKKLPPDLENVYEPQRYLKFITYEKAGIRFNLVESVFSTTAILLVLFLGGFSWLDNYLHNITTNPVLLALAFFGIWSFVSDLAGIPFEIYETFVIEKKYGFNTMTIRTYVTDKLKSWLLGAILGGIIISVIVWLYLIFNNWFWIFALAVVVVFSLVMNFFYSTLIVPMFNKQTPLPEGDLHDAITAFFRRINFNFRQIFIIDGSKRSLKANAYFSGFGKNRRVVIYDTLVNILTLPELVAVLAHEIGHYKKKHIYFNIILGALQTALLLYLFSILMRFPHFSLALSNHVSFHISLLVFSFLYGPLSLLIGLLGNKVSRKFEYEADAFAASNGVGSHLANALKKLCSSNLSNLNPHPWYIFFHYSHPSLGQRLSNLTLFQSIAEAAEK